MPEPSERLASIGRILAAYADTPDHVKSPALRARLEELRAERDRLLAKQSSDES